MRLDELTIPKGRHNATHILILAGYKLLGRGSWGSVFQKPAANYVLKLFDNIDTAYSAFIGVCKANEGNPYLPKIIGKPLRVTSGYSAIRLELLHPIPDFNSNLADLVGMCEYYIKYQDYAPKLPLSPFGEEVLKSREFMEDNLILKEACDLLSKFIPPFELDFNQNNVMLRDGKQYVFTDPLMNPNA